MRKTCLSKAGFKPIEKLQASTEIPIDTIINQDPKGMKVKEGANDYAIY